MVCRSDPLPAYNGMQVVILVLCIIWPKQELLRLVKKTTTIQYGYRNSGTHARVSSQTLAHGNIKSEIRKTQMNKLKKRRWNMKINTAGSKKNFNRPYCSSGLPSPRISYSQKQWMNHLTNQTYNPYTAPWGAAAM